MQFFENDFERVSGWSVFAVDTETDSKDARKANLKHIIVGDGVVAVRFDYTQAALEKLTPIILRAKTAYFQNFKYDYTVLKRHGLDLSKVRFRDSMLMHHLIDENEEHGLDYMVQKYYNDNYKERFWSQYETYDSAPHDVALDYACRDACYTFRLCETFQERLDDKHSLVEHVHNLALSLWHTEYNGVRIDTPAILEYAPIVQDKILHAKAAIRPTVEAECQLWEMNKWLEELGKRKTDKGKAGVKRPEFNIASAAQKQWLMYEALKFPVVNKTKAGKPGTDYDTLDKLKKVGVTHPLLDRLIDYSGMETLYNTFVVGLLERQEDGQIYPDFNINGTLTGRISSSNPNLQNMPKEGIYRSFFIPTDGNVFFGADYCFPAAITEYLTEAGWKTADQLSSLDVVWQVNKDTLKGSFIKPLRVIQRDYEGEVHTYGNSRGKLMVTKNHRMLWVGQQSSNQESNKAHRHVSLAQDGVPHSAASLTNFSKSDSKSYFSERSIWMTCMVQADASKAKAGNWRIEVSEERKRTKIRELLGVSGTVCTPRSTQRKEVERWSSFEFSCELLKDDKTFDLSELGANQADRLVDALTFWGGSRYGRRRRYYTTVRENAEQVQRYLVRSGYEAKISLKETNNPKQKDLYTVSIKKGGQTRLRKSDVVVSHYKGPISCVTVPEGFILVRQSGQVFLTGNCQLEVVIEANLSGDEQLKKIVMEGASKHDITNNELKLGSRDLAKTLNFAMQYHCSVFKVAELLKISKQEAQYVYDKFWEVYKGVKALKEYTDKCVDDWQPIVSPFGRARHMPGKFSNQREEARAKRQAYNALIQGTGADCTHTSFHRRANAIRCGRLLFPIHDEILGECKPENVEAEKEALTKTMASIGDELGFKIPLSAKSYGPLAKWSKT